MGHHCRRILEPFSLLFSPPKRQAGLHVAGKSLLQALQAGELIERPQLRAVDAKELQMLAHAQRLGHPLRCLRSEESLTFVM